MILQLFLLVGLRLCYGGKSRGERGRRICTLNREGRMTCPGLGRRSEDPRDLRLETKVRIGWGDGEVVSGGFLCV